MGYSSSSSACYTQSTMPATAVIAEDHEITREGLSRVLERRLNVDVVATTGDGLEAFSLLKTHRPDLLVLDLSLPHLDGLDLLHKMRERDLSVGVVVLSMNEESRYVQQAFELGASAFVLKGSPLEELIEAVSKVLEGSTYLSTNVIAKLSEDTASASDEETRHESLSDREREVLQLTAEGLTSKEIGEKLYISHRTVEKHRENIKEKLEVQNAVEMARHAFRRGLISGPGALQ